MNRTDATAHTKSGPQLAIIPVIMIAGISEREIVAKSVQLSAGAFSGQDVMTIATDRRPGVRCADDDDFLLNVLPRTIGVDYEVLTSSSAEALHLIENSDPIQVVVSDHRMSEKGETRCFSET